MDVEGLYWNKINVLIDIVLIGGVGGEGVGSYYISKLFLLKKKNRKKKNYHLLLVRGKEGFYRSILLDL